MFSPRDILLLTVLSMVFVSYFSTLAILSVAVSINIRKIKLNESQLVLLLHGFSVLSSLIVFLTRSNSLLIGFQTFVFIVALLALALKSGKYSKLVSQNRLIYLLLFLFWILNIIASARRILPFEAKIFLYFVSAGLFFSIFLRVRKRLVNGKKKRPS